MRSVAVISSDIERGVRELYADSAKALLKPMMEGGRCFLSSDVCIRIARRRSEDPSGLARELLKRIQPGPGEHWVQHAGYLNITVSGEGISEVKAPCPEVRHTLLYVPLRPAGVSPAALVRLAAPAVLQAWMLTKRDMPVSLRIGDQAIGREGAGSLAGMLHTVIEQSCIERSPTVDMRSVVLGLWRQHRSGTCCFSLFPGDVEHTLWRDGGKDPGFDEQVTVFIPERGWLADIDSIQDAWSGLKRDERSVLALLLHLCSSSRGVDIEWRVADFAERKNLLWCLESTRSRLSVFSESMSAGGVPPGPSVLPAETGFLCRFIEVYFLRALIDGEVVEWAAAVALLLENISCLLNDPGLRIERAGQAPPLQQFYPLLIDATSSIYSFFHVD